MTYAKCFELICLTASLVCLLFSMSRHQCRALFTDFTGALLMVPFIAIVAVLAAFVCVGALMGVGIIVFRAWRMRRVREIPIDIRRDRRTVEQLERGTRIEQAFADMHLEREYDRRVLQRKLALREARHLQLVAGTDFLTRRQAG
jgi:hypothetical protein